MATDWKGQKVAIVGAARQGLALARYLLQQGAFVVLNDQKPLEQFAEAQATLSEFVVQPGQLEWVCGGHPLSLLEGMDLLCPSGGVPLDLPLVREAQRRGIALSNDSQIFLEAAPCKVIGVTGSAGKTTTTMLVGRIAQAALEIAATSTNSVIPYRKVWVGGNIGAPMISVLHEMQPDDLAVMELSSFQLELMNRSPQVSAVLNITPNHLDRHGTMEAYTAAKARILDFQTAEDVAVLGRDDRGAWSLAQRVKGRLLSFGFSELPNGHCGVSLYGDAVYLREAPGATEIYILAVQDIALRGMHNLFNVMAASAIAAGAGLPVRAIRQGVRGFVGAPHRLEFVRSWGGADWYNDSIATAPERSMAAIRSFEEPLVLLLGGRDKNLPWDDLAMLALRRVDHVIVFGEAADLILKAFERAANYLQSEVALGLEKQGLQSVTRCTNLRQAVEAAAQIVQPGDVVLLSPGGTSFDEFKDFEERGQCFAQWVRELK